MIFTDPRQMLGDKNLSEDSPDFAPKKKRVPSPSEFMQHKSPNEEPKFRSWYAERAKRLKLNPDPDDPQHFYDYRAAYKAGAEPDETGHWPSEFKREGHPNLFVGGADTRTGKKVPSPSEFMQQSRPKRDTVAEAEAAADRVAAEAQPKGFDEEHPFMAGVLNALQKRVVEPYEGAAKAAEEFTTFGVTPETFKEEIPLHRRVARAAGRTVRGGVGALSYPFTGAAELIAPGVTEEIFGPPGRAASEFLTAGAEMFIGRKPGQLPEEVTDTTEFVGHLAPFVAAGQMAHGMPPAKPALPVAPLPKTPGFVERFREQRKARQAEPVSPEAQAAAQEAPPAVKTAVEALKRRQTPPPPTEEAVAAPVEPAKGVIPQAAPTPEGGIAGTPEAGAVVLRRQAAAIRARAAKTADPEAQAALIRQAEQVEAGAAQLDAAQQRVAARKAAPPEEPGPRPPQRRFAIPAAEEPPPSPRKFMSERREELAAAPEATPQDMVVALRAEQTELGRRRLAATQEERAIIDQRMSENQTLIDDLERPGEPAPLTPARTAGALEPQAAPPELPPPAAVVAPAAPKPVAAPPTPTEFITARQAAPVAQQGAVAAPDAPVLVRLSDVATDPKRFQPREGLMEGRVEWISDQMREKGYDPKEPLTVWTDPKDGKTYVLAGHHRYEAAARAGLDQVPANVFRGTEAEAMAYARRSNSQPAPLSPIAEAKAFATEQGEGRSNAEIAKQYGGIKESVVEDRLALNNLPPVLQGYVTDGTFKLPLATALGKAAGKYKLSPELQTEIFDNFIKRYDVTPAKLAQAIDTLAPLAQQQLTLGLGFKMERGFTDALVEMLDKASELEGQRKSFRSAVSKIDKMRKAGKEVPKNLVRAQRALLAETTRLEREMTALQSKLGMGKEPPLKKALKEPTPTEKKMVVREPVNEAAETAAGYRAGDHVKVEVDTSPSSVAEGVPEWIWVKAESFDDANRVVYGTVDSQPIASGLRLGQKIRVSYDNIVEHRRFEETPKVKPLSPTIGQEETAPAPSKGAFPADLAKRLLALPPEQRVHPFGDYNVKLRQDVIEFVTGKRPNVSKAGAGATRDALLQFFGIEKTGKAPIQYEREAIARLEEAAKAEALKLEPTPAQGPPPAEEAALPGMESAIQKGKAALAERQRRQMEEQMRTPEKVATQPKFGEAQPTPEQIQSKMEAMRKAGFETSEEIARDAILREREEPSMFAFPGGLFQPERWRRLIQTGKRAAKSAKEIAEDALAALRGETPEATEARKTARREATIAEEAKAQETSPFQERMQAKVALARGKVEKTIDGLSKAAQIAMEEAETVAETGTLGKEARIPFRKAVPIPKAETYEHRISEKDARAGMAQLVATARDVAQLQKELAEQADPLSSQAAKAASNAMDAAAKRLEEAVKQASKQRYAAGRTVASYNVPLPADVIGTLRSAGMILDGIRNIKERTPIATNILRGIRNWKKLTPVERQQFFRDLVDHMRFNLFSVTSWTLDAVQNLAEAGAQVVGGVGHDIVYAARTSQFQAPAMEGMLRAIRFRWANRFKEMGEEFEGAFGKTVSGEKVPGRVGGKAGTFTYREGVGPEGSVTRKVTKAGSTIYDYLVGGPLYAKGIADLAAKRIMSTAVIFREAIKEANRLGLKGNDRLAFYKKYMENIPEATRTMAIEEGNKAGMNRTLSKLEERAASSIWARLLVDPYMRWPFQFARWSAEMLGYNKEILGRMSRGEATPEEVGQYLAKTATGWGGLYLLSHMYEDVDFNTMEYVDKEGNRKRLSSREPLASAMWFLAVVKGDWDRAAAGLRYASVPATRLLAGEGGLLGSVFQAFKRALDNPQNDPKAIMREMENQINRAIPGQAILSALKTLFDPTIREGVGANIPGYSQKLPAAVDPTTGEPMQPRQRVLGVEVPSISGVPLPGATRILNPVQKLLNEYGLMVYRGPQQPIAGYPAAKAPAEHVREWKTIFGRKRNEYLMPIVEDWQAGRLKDYDYEEVRKMIQAEDSRAAREATDEINEKYGTTDTEIPRSGTRRERAGPKRMRP